MSLIIIIFLLIQFNLYSRILSLKIFIINTKFNKTIINKFSHFLPDSSFFGYYLFHYFVPGVPYLLTLELPSNYIFIAVLDGVWNCLYVSGLRTAD